MEHVTRIVIADDHPMFREGLAKAVEHHEEFLIVGKAGDGAEALRLIKELRPDLAVLDVSMPKMDGLEVARAVHREALPTEIVILTMYKELTYFNAALDLGVRGYILKDIAISEFLSCLKSVTEGQYYISPSIAHLLVEREKKAQSLATSVPALQRLTPAERAILKLVAQNLTSREISEKIFVSVRTVENHRTHICQKLGIKGHNKLLEFALQNKSAL
ncbi:MAG: response regulator transcription factor [Ignavibacteriales bacterium]|nr:response regulator transcription factor [Ignavibacteriales bacterium]